MHSLLNEVDFLDELILNYDPKAFFKYLRNPE